MRKITGETMVRKTIVLMALALIVTFANINGFAQKQILLPTPVNNLDSKQDSPCCPPIWGESFNKYFRVHQLPGKNITETYGLEFLPNAALDTQMQAYAPYAGLYAPAGWVGNSVHLNAEMREIVKPVTSAGNPIASDFYTLGFTPVLLGPNPWDVKGSLRAWWTTGTGFWNGPHTVDVGSPHNWEDNYKDGVHAHSDLDPLKNHMKPNKWYMIKLTLQLASKKPGVQDSWRQDDIACSVVKPRYVAISMRSVGAKMAPGASAKDAAEIIEVK